MKKRNEIIPYLKGLKRRTFFLLFFFFFISALFSRVPIESIKTSSPPKIDGVLDDPVWKKARGYSDFKTIYPDFGKSPKEKTIVYSAYDTDNLYFALKCFESDPKKIIGTIKKRDSINSEDHIGIIIDSHNDSQNGYYFLVNPLGIQQDGITDSETKNDWAPDFIWESMGVKNAEGYAIEVKIPFKTLRFANAKVVTMRISFTRYIRHYSEVYSFPEWKAKGSPLSYLGYCQIEGIKYNRVFQVLPAFTYMKNRKRQVETLDSSHEKSLGLTSKIGVTSNLTLDITLNPDFSHIEIDEGQVDVNLRVEPLYKEKRPFFLEGLEHFKFAGCDDDSPIEKIVHTRNIIEPIWGIKLSGKIGRANVINSLFSVDESSKYNGAEVSTPGDVTGNDYYGIFRYKHLLKNDSYLGTIYTGKEFKFDNGEGVSNGFNRVGGLDSRIRIEGFVILDTFFLYSFNKMFNKNTETADNTEGSAFGGKLQYEDRKNFFALNYHDLSTDFQLEPGRLVRNGIRKFSASAARYIFPRSDFLKLITLGYSGDLSRDKLFNMNEYSHMCYISSQLPYNTTLLFGYSLATEVYEGVLFDKDRFSVEVSSNLKHLQLGFQYSSGGSPFYHPSSPFQGHLKTLFISFNFQPNKNFSTQFNWTNHIFQGDEVSTEDYNVSIYRNKTIFQVNKYLSLRGIVEYHTVDKSILGDALVEFTYIPGTVIHLGYGSTFSKRHQFGDRYFIYDRFKEIRNSIFFKASYLFRF